MSRDEGVAGGRRNLLLVAFNAVLGVFTSLITATRGWYSRRSAPEIQVALGGDNLELSGPKQEDQDRLISEYLQRLEAGERASKVPGAAADQVKLTEHEQASDHSSSSGSESSIPAEVIGFCDIPEDPPESHEWGFDWTDGLGSDDGGNGDGGGGAASDSGDEGTDYGALSDSSIHEDSDSGSDYVDYEEPAEVREAGPRDQSEAPVQAPIVTYDDLVHSAFAALVRPGRLLFNPPDRMKLGQTERVEVRLARTLELDAEILQNLGGQGNPQLEEIPTAPRMAVTLQGDGFRIKAYSDEVQAVTKDDITIWQFDICAIKQGQQRLVICVSLRIPVPGQPLEHKSIPVREATINVQVGMPALVGHFVSGNWQWFIGTAIALAAVLVAVLVHLARLTS